MTRALVLFTTNHPFTFTGGETMFVAPELAHLAATFAPLHVVPLHDRGDRLALPAGVTLHRDLAQRWRWLRIGYYLLAPAWPGFAAEYRDARRRGGWVGAARVWRWAAVAQATRSWLRRHRAETQGALLYTYWRGGQTLACARDRHSTAVTRVHGYDLYPDAFAPPYQPWTSVYRSLARVIAVAQHGADALAAHGVDRERVHISRLGVAAAAARSPASDDGACRIVSCASLIALKRVELLARALVALAVRHPQQRLHWTHFGDGPLQADVRAALAGAPRNLSTRLAGRVANADVLAHYAREPVDLFVQLSRSEGLPVALQEALAAGVPVLATAVGGVPEAVGDDNGALLPPEPTLDEVVTALERLLFDPDPVARQARRDASWQRWARDFDADRNHAALARELAAL